MYACLLRGFSCVRFFATPWTVPCLIGDVIGIEGTRACNWMLSGVSSLFCGCHSPIWGRICSPLVGVEAPSSVSESRREVGGTRVLPLGEELPRIPRHALCGVASRLMCAFTKCTLVGTDLGPSSPTGMQAVGPEAPQALCSHSHQHSSDGTDPLKLGTRTCHSCVYSHTWPHCGSCRVSPVSSCTCTCAHLQSLQLLVPDLHTHRSTSNSLRCPEGAELTEAPAPKSSKDAGTWLRFQPHLHMWAAHRHLHAARALGGGATPAVSTREGE